MLTHSLRRWPVIETAVGYCTVLHYAGDALTSRRQKKTYNMIHWPNAVVMLGSRLRRWANIIPT